MKFLKALALIPKLVTHKGRVKLARGILMKELTGQRLCGIAIGFGIDILNGGVKRMKDPGGFHTGISSGRDALVILEKVTDPASEGGVQVSDSERIYVTEGLSALTNQVLSEDVINAIRDYILSKVP